MILKSSSEKIQYETVRGTSEICSSVAAKSRKLYLSMWHEGGTSAAEPGAGVT